MGSVNLIHGDCLEEMTTIEDRSIDLVLTDPPYGTTKCSWDSVIPFEPMWKHLDRIIKDSGVVLLFSAEPFTSNLIISNISNFKYRLTWNKVTPSGFLNSHKKPLVVCEDICVFSKVKLGHSTYNPQLVDREKSKRRKTPLTSEGVRTAGVYGDFDEGYSKSYDGTKRHPTDLIKINTQSGECYRPYRVHPTQKPVRLLEYLLKTYTNEGETVLDFTMGSGSTGVACRHLSRNFIGIEKEEKYMILAKNRLY